ncbi:MAG: hypothetical protein IKU58_10015 [Clostridia bacterium]|nr:hypothetical protein [Clostridia bacterium]
MKKRIVLTVLVLLAAVCAVIAAALFGNPLSKALAARTAKAHMAAHHPFYTLERVGYNFKDGHYYAHLTDGQQIDGDFSLSLGWWGNLLGDDYAYRVTGGENTRSRLSMEYRALVTSVLETPEAGLPLDFGFGDLEIWSREASLHDDCPAYALITEDLPLNGTYDVRALGARAGHLVYYLQVEEPSLEGLAHWLLEIRRLMDASGVPFADIDLTLRYLRDDGEQRPESDLYVLHFPYADIFEEGLFARVEQANADAVAYYAQMDKEQ